MKPEYRCILLLLLLAGCAPARVPTPDLITTYKSTCLMRVHKSLEGIDATGSVVVRCDTSSRQRASRYVSLAAGRAWLEIATSMCLYGCWDMSILASRKGLDELGTMFKNSRFEDDTSILVDMAMSDILQGRQDMAARALIGALGARLNMYADKFSDDIIY